MASHDAYFGSATNDRNKTVVLSLGGHSLAGLRTVSLAALRQGPPIDAEIGHRAGLRGAATLVTRSNSIYDRCSSTPPTVGQAEGILDLRHAS